MARFNIALLPLDAKFQEAIADLAQSHFKVMEDGYLLGKHALAHITLCQFHAPNEQAALNVFHLWPGRRELVLLLKRFNLRKGESEHAGKLWAEILIERNPDLLKQQEVCFQHLTQAGLEVLTPVKDYSPHLTLARIADTAVTVPSPDLPAQRSIAFRPSVGASTENGVFVKALLQEIQDAA